ncbi:MAG: MarC family protein [Phycisphaerales bacterium]|nr:MarC family protein [bacterium]
MFSTAALLFFIIDPFGLIPLFLSVLNKLPEERRTKVLVRELLIALVALLVFLVAGKYLLRTLHISEPALTIAGAIILFLISLTMVFPSIKLSMESEGSGEPFIVPLAIPLFAGPSAIALVMLIGSGQQPGGWPQWIGAVVIAWAGASAVLLLGAKLAKLVGARGLIALERLMGMLLIAISVEMMLSGISLFQATVAAE